MRLPLYVRARVQAFLYLFLNIKWQDCPRVLRTWIPRQLILELFMSPRYQPQLLSLSEQAELGLNSTSSVWESESHHHLLSVNSQPQFLWSYLCLANSVSRPSLTNSHKWPRPSISGLDPFTAQPSVRGSHHPQPATTNTSFSPPLPENMWPSPPPGRPGSQAWSLPPTLHPFNAWIRVFTLFTYRVHSGDLSTCLDFGDTL